MKRFGRVARPQNGSSMRNVLVSLLFIVFCSARVSVEAFSVVQQRFRTPNCRSPQALHFRGTAAALRARANLPNLSALTRQQASLTNDVVKDASSRYRRMLRVAFSGLLGVATVLLLSRRTALASDIVLPQSEALLRATTVVTRADPSLGPPLSRAMELRLTVRLLYAAVAGSMVGWERSSSKHSAGIRTMSLVSLGAAAFTICSMYGFVHLNTRYDPSRIASNIVSGVGFVGAGVITTATHQHRADNPKRKPREINVVHGLTTAAAIWLSAAVGVASGLGLFYIAGTAATSTIAILRFGRLTHSSGRGKKHTRVFRRNRGSSEMLDTSTWDEVPEEYTKSSGESQAYVKEDLLDSIRTSFNETGSSSELFATLEDPEEQKERIRARSRDQREDSTDKKVSP